MSILDDPEARSRLDAAGMLARIRDLGRQCRAAWQEASAFAEALPADKIVVLGMGGSAIAGDYLRALLALESRVPVLNCRGYDLPSTVDQNTLLIASSYSGNTEETLSAFQQGLATAAKKVAITSGGQLLATARANGIPTFSFDYRAEPRAALGYSLMPLLAIAEKIGVTQGMEADVEEAVAIMEDLQGRIDATIPQSGNLAKQLAERLYGHLPVIYGAGFLAAVAHRWKTQLNENAKVWAFYEELPEANHNAIVGYALPPSIAQAAFVIFLRSPALHPRLLLRYQLTQQALAEAGVAYETVEGEGRSPLAQMMSLTLFGDYVSYYLALLNGVAPSPTQAIDELKARLGEQK